MHYFIVFLYKKCNVRSLIMVTLQSTNIKIKSIPFAQLLASLLLL